MNKRGFTLIELLVVIAIVGILSSVIYTNITGLRDRAKVTAGIRFDSSALHSIGDQLVGEWLFDTNASSTLDTSGSGNNGTPVGPPTWQETGGYNNKGAYSFDGSDYFVTTLLPSNNNSGTLSAWVKTLSSSPQMAFGSYSSALNKRNYISVGNTTVGGKCTAGVGGHSYDVIKGTTNLNDGNWHFCAVSYDGTKVQLYADGKLEFSINQSGTTDSGYVYFLGATNSSGVPINPFIGSVDNIRIYQSALSGSDIQKLYAEGKTSHEVATK